VLASPYFGAWAVLGRKQRRAAVFFVISKNSSRSF